MYHRLHLRYLKQYDLFINARALETALFKAHVADSSAQSEHLPAVLSAAFNQF